MSNNNNDNILDIPQLLPMVWQLTNVDNIETDPRKERLNRKIMKLKYKIPNEPVILEKPQHVIPK